MKVRNICIALLGAALTAALPVTALAQTPEQEKLGVALSHEIFQAVDIKTGIAAGAATALAKEDFLQGARPEWSRLLVEALNEEVEQDGPAMEAVLGHTLAKRFTAEEMSAGLVVLRDPAMRAIMGAASRHQPTPPASNPPCGRDCMTAMASPAGRAFMTKFSDLGAVMDKKFQGELIAVIAPGMFIRFGQKAQASERARAAAGAGH